MKRAFSMIIGFLTGALVGSAAAILLAPSSGKQLRSDITGYTDQMRREMELAAQTRRVELEEQLARLRGEIVSE